MTNQRDFAAWEARFAARVQVDESVQGVDPAHDLAHFERVVATAKALALAERARLEVVIPAAWLHDLVNVPKNDPRRSQASRLSAQAGREFLASIGYPSWAAPGEEDALLDAIGHAIEAHSYSAKIEARTLEARIVQDADRLDGLGAIGVARCFAVAGLLHRRLYHPHDPFGVNRRMDDLVDTVDHFYIKLFKTVETLQTEAGRAEGRRRAAYMKDFLAELGREIGIPAPA